MDNKNIQETTKKLSLYRAEFTRWRDPIKAMAEKYKKKREPVDDFHDNLDNDFQGESSYVGPVMQTDFGILPINELGLGSSQLNFWECNVNFHLTEKHFYILNTTLGVEAFMVKTPYRFIFAIGKLFDEKEVMERLKNALLKSQEDNNFLDKITTLKASLSKQYKFFAIINFNGKNQVLHGNSAEEVEAQIKSFTEKNGKHEISKSY